MENRTTINKEVNITAWYFRNKHQQLTSYPKRMEYNREEYNFGDGLRFLIQKGRQAVQLFDMTDGSKNYRLQFDTKQQIWTLVSITNAARAF